MAEILKPFGRYFLLDLLSRGGMAEIYRAERLTPLGASQLVVLKKIQTSHASRKDYHQMFWSEVSLMMRFRHPNIAQLHDFGEENGQPFLTLEYIRGLSLWSFLSRLREHKKPIPFEFALWTGIQAATGLDYAHSFRDPFSGRPLNIVHRDISPHNILVSFEGDVKLIDFGISKAAVLEEITHTGTLKGKPGYMAPEYIADQGIDARFDVFSLGVILWEMLTGRRLFNAGNERAVLKQVQATENVIRAPSQVNPRCPEEIDQVILKALERNPARRYQSAAEFRKDLRKILIFLSPSFNGAEFARQVQELLAAEIATERQTMRALLEKSELIRTIENEHQQNSVSVSMTLNEFTRPNLTPTKTKITPPRHKTISALPPRLVRATPLRQASVGHGENAFPKKTIPPKHPHSSNSKGSGWMTIALLLGLVTLHQSWLQTQRKPSLIQALTSPPPKEIARRVVNRDLRLKISGQNGAKTQIPILRSPTSINRTSEDIVFTGAEPPELSKSRTAALIGDSQLVPIEYFQND